MTVKLAWNFLFLVCLIIGFLIVLNLINRTVGMPDFLRLEMFEELLKRMRR